MKEPDMSGFQRVPMELLQAVVALIEEQDTELEWRRGPVEWRHRRLDGQT